MKNLLMLLSFGFLITSQTSFIISCNKHIIDNNDYIPPDLIIDLADCYKLFKKMKI